VSRVTQGCQPVGPARTSPAATPTWCSSSTASRPAAAAAGPADDDLATTAARCRKLRATLAGLSDAATPRSDRGGQFGPDVRVRHLIGLDPGRQAVALADRVAPEGMRLAFCGATWQAARRDLVRICAEIREELEAEADACPPAWRQRPTRRRASRGAVYVSCAGRGGPHFGAPSAELKIVQHALGDVPLVGFFAGGEIARHHLYGYTGVLTVFSLLQALYTGIGHAKAFGCGLLLVRPVLDNRDIDA
jgi:hypothetical protein